MEELIFMTYDDTLLWVNNKYPMQFEVHCQFMLFISCCSCFTVSCFIVSCFSVSEEAGKVERFPHIWVVWGREGWWEVEKEGREGGRGGVMAGGDTTHLSSLQLSVVIDSDGPPDYQSVRRTEIIILTAQLPPHDHHHVTLYNVTSRHSWESGKQQTTTERDILLAAPPDISIPPAPLLDSSQPIYLCSKCCGRPGLRLRRSIYYIYYE